MRMTSFSRLEATRGPFQQRSRNSRQSVLDLGGGEVLLEARPTVSRSGSSKLRVEPAKNSCRKECKAETRRTDGKKRPRLVTKFCLAQLEGRQSVGSKQWGGEARPGNRMQYRDAPRLEETLTETRDGELRK